MSEGTLSGGQVSIPVKPNTSGFGRSMHEGIRGEASGLGGLGKELGGMLLAGVAAAGITMGIGEFIKRGVEEYGAVDAANAQFTAGMVSTGNVANLNVKSMNDLASSIANYSGQSDESILKTEQVLQTFTNIRNLGPDKIFDQATTAAANMAAKLGGSASDSAIQLGKALNDPVKGMTALRRMGVAFTKEQTDQVKAMVASGDIMGAQKVILGELTTEFGGAAEAAGKTLPGMLGRAHVAFGDLAKTIVGTAMPAVMSVLDVLIEGEKKIQDAPGFQVLIKHLTDFATNSADKLVGFFDKVIAAFSSGSKSPLGDIAAQLAKSNPLLSVLLTVAQALQPILPMVFDALSKIAPQLIPVIPVLAKVVVELLPSLLQIIQAILPILPGVAAGLVAVAPAITGIAAGLAYMMSLQTGVSGFFAGLQSNLLAGKTSFSDFLALFLGAGPAFTGIINGVSNFIVGGVNLVIDALNSLSGALAFAMNPIASLLNLPGRIVSFQIPHMLTATLGAAGPTGTTSVAGGPIRAAAKGGTFQPTPGGQLVNLAEAGRAETVVDTATLQAAMSRTGGGDTFHIYETTSAVATAMQVSRRQNALAAG